MTRWVLCLLALAVLVPAAVVVGLHMPSFGHYTPAYGDAINHYLPGLRHATDIVTAIIFDVRGMDTLGEEFIFVAASTGVTVLLRGKRGEDAYAKPMPAGRPLPARSEAIGLVVRWMVPGTLAFGLYVLLHAQLTPGGGFQAGAILASGLLLVFLGDGYRLWRVAVPPQIAKLAESGGAAAYVVLGLVPMFVGARFLANVLPQGPAKSILSGGLMPLLNLAVGLAIVGGFVTILVEIIEETREPDKGEGA